MQLSEERSINKWAQMLRDSDTKAQLIGYRCARETPAVSTYYAFIYRIFDYYQRMASGGEGRPSDLYRHHRVQRRELVSGRSRRKKLEQESGERQRRAEGVTDLKLAEVSGWREAPVDFVQMVNRVLLEVMGQSLEMGVLEAKDLALCVDGSLYQSQANGEGRRRCGCGDFSCQCTRAYGDPTAGWGYSKSKDEYVFGHRVSAMVARGGGSVELPVQVLVSPPHVGEEPLCLEGLARLWHERLGLRLGGRKAIPAEYLVADLGYCGAAIHQGVQGFGLKPVIPLLSVSRLRGAEGNGCTVGEDRVPRCPSGQPMKKHFSSVLRGTCFRCPAREGRRGPDGKLVYVVNPALCALPVMCDSTSKIGPTLYVRSGSYDRLNPEIPRESPLFKEVYARRGCVERFFSRLKCSGGAVQTRRLPVLQFMAVIRAIACHVQAWDRLLI